MPGRVLVIDDLEINRRLIEAKLGHQYYHVLLAADGPTGLALAREETPDIVLLDVMMPEMDGYEVCRRLKADPRTAHIPVIMVTALGERKDRVRGLDAGADDFLTKPMSDAVLFARVRSLIRLKTTLDELRLREQTSRQLGSLGDGSGAERQPANARILVLEDDPASVAAIETHLQRNHSVEVIADPSLLVGRARTGAFDLLIVSLTQRNADGLRICSNLHADATTRHLPVLVLVHEGDIERIAKALDVGATDCITKPIDPLELGARISTQVRRKRYHDRLRATLEESVSLAVTDSLTGLFNRRYADAHLERLMQRPGRDRRAVSVAIADIDHFKAVNDTFGHAVGDEVLREFAQRLSDDVRGVDLMARYGGEEFLIVMSDVPLATATTIADRLRGTICGKPFTPPSLGRDLPVTVSIGVATVEGGDLNVADLLRLADAALYDAKRAGRNRVMAATRAA